MIRIQVPSSAPSSSNRGDCWGIRTIVTMVVASLVAIALGISLGYLYILASPTEPSPSSQDQQQQTSSSSVSFRETTRGFTIEFIYTTPVSDEYRQVFAEAKLVWERLIVKDFFTSVRAAKGVVMCNQPPLEEDLLIQDLIIFVSVIKIDGVGQILGQAGPCGFDGAGRVRVGVMKFDEDDIDRHFLQTVKHELGHVLGIGSVWEERNLVSNGSDASPSVYLGPKGNEGHRLIGGQGEAAAIESHGGQGTAGSHWEDSLYPNEMMTGFLTADSKQPISALTVLALSDVGFTVDVTKADEFKARNDDEEADVDLSSKHQQSSYEDDQPQLPTPDLNPENPHGEMQPIVAPNRRRRLRSSADRATYRIIEDEIIRFTKDSIVTLDDE